MADLRQPTDATAGPLTPHPTNGRYFADRHGKPVYLTGSHTWATIQEAGPSDPPDPFDWPGWLDLLLEHNHNFTRLWTWEHPKWGSWWQGDYFITPLPWARTGPGVARDGKPKFDLTRFDPEFFSRLRRRIEDCRERGIYVSVMLFQGWSCAKKFSPQGPDPWQSHPFESENNINAIDGSGPEGAAGEWVHTLHDMDVTHLLEMYVRETIDAVNEFDNVMYEIINECDGTPENTAWHYHMINVVHRYECQRKALQHAVLMTGQFMHNNPALFASAAEAVSPSGWGRQGDEYWDTDPPVRADKVVLLDPDHIWGVGGTVDWVWRVFTRGHNPLYMDPWGYGHMEPRFDAAGDASLRRAMGQTRRLAERLDLACTAPAGELTSTRFALANPGRDYVVYQPAPEGFRVDLSDAQGVFEVTWWGLEGGCTEGGPIRGGRPVGLDVPGGGPGVVQLTRSDEAIDPTQIPD